MGSVNAELKRRDTAGNLVDWILNADGTSPVADETARARLADIVTTLQGTLSVNVGNHPADFPLPSAQITTLTPQTDALTDTQLRASPVSVNLQTSEFPLPSAQVTTLTPQTDALTDTQLRATPVPIDDGHTQPLTDTQLRASDVGVADSAARTTLASLDGKDFATQTTLASVLADLQGKRDGTEAEPLYTSSPVSAKIASGAFFLFSSSRSVAAGSEATWSLENPSASGKVIKLIHVSAANDSTEQIRFDIYKNSTITGGTARTPWDPNFASASTSIATVTDGVGIRSGGTQLEAKVPVVRDAPYTFEGLLVIPPGVSLQLTGVVPGALSAQQLTVGARWYEE